MVKIKFGVMMCEDCPGVSERIGAVIQAGTVDTTFCKRSPMNEKSMKKLEHYYAV